MIENQFKLGVMFEWSKPSNVDGPRDGAIVNGEASSPQLKYVGLGAVVDPALMQYHVKMYGLEMNAPTQYQWLNYVPGRTARASMGKQDLLTGPMSGCIIAKWNDKGTNYIGHIGTVESDAKVNKDVKAKFTESVTTKGNTGFNPASSWDLNECLQLMQKVGISNRPDIFALVTTSGQMYSIAMVKMDAKDGANRWYCLGCKKMDAVALDVLL